MKLLKTVSLEKEANNRWESSICAIKNLFLIAKFLRDLSSIIFLCKLISIV